MIEFKTGKYTRSANETHAKLAVGMKALLGNQKCQARSLKMKFIPGTRFLLMGLPV